MLEKRDVDFLLELITDLSQDDEGDDLEYSEYLLQLKEKLQHVQNDAARSFYPYVGFNPSGHTFHA